MCRQGDVYFLKRKVEIMVLFNSRGVTHKTDGCTDPETNLHQDFPLLENENKSQPVQYSRHSFTRLMLIPTNSGCIVSCLETHRVRADPPHLPRSLLHPQVPRHSQPPHGQQAAPHALHCLRSFCRPQTNVQQISSHHYACSLLAIVKPI